MANQFVHNELSTNDVPKAKEFYRKLFDWKLQDIPNDASGGSYTMVDTGSDFGGGIMQHPMPGAPSFWLSYVSVDDIKAGTEKARLLGATVIKDVLEVMDMGWLSIIQDPTGAVLGLWQSKPQQ